MKRSTKRQYRSRNTVNENTSNLENEISTATRNENQRRKTTNQKKKAQNTKHKKRRQGVEHKTQSTKKGGKESSTIFTTTDRSERKRQTRNQAKQEEMNQAKFKERIVRKGEAGKAMVDSEKADKQKPKAQVVWKYQRASPISSIVLGIKSLPLISSYLSYRFLRVPMP
jgi:hypothetical protein